MTEASGRTRLGIALRRMPYSGMLYMPKWGDGMTDEEYMDYAAEWLEKLIDVQRRYVDEFNDTHKELHEIKQQRNAVRAFLGMEEI